MFDPVDVDTGAGTHWGNKRQDFTLDPRQLKLILVALISLK